MGLPVAYALAILLTLLLGFVNSFVAMTSGAKYALNAVVIVVVGILLFCGYTGAGSHVLR